MLVYAGKLFIRARSLLRGAHKTLGAAAITISQEKYAASNGIIKSFPRHSVSSCHVTLMFCHETCAILQPLCLSFQEALASFDVRSAHGLSHDPMPVQDELNRYVFSGLSVI